MMTNLTSETYLAYVNGVNEDIHVTVVSYETQKIKLNLKFAKAKDFIDRIESLFKSKFKAVILNVFNVQSGDFCHNLEFCKIIKEKLAQLKIGYTFISHIGYLISSFLIAEKIGAIFNEKILICLFENEKCFSNQIKFTKDGWEILDKNSPENIANEKNIKKIVGSSNPENIGQFLVERYKWMQSKNYRRFYVIPRAARKYEIGFKKDKNKTRNVILCNEKTQLPFNVLDLIPKASVEFYMAFHQNGKRYELETFMQDKNAHRYDIGFDVNENNFPKYLLVPQFLKNVENLPKKLDEKLESKVPVICMFDNTSVMCVYNEEQKGYQFMVNWNGKFGKECLIAFDKEKITYFENAEEASRTKPSFVICDLLKIMSLPLKEALAIKTLAFKITKDSKNPILCEFDNFDGKKKMASPAFLTALLLKQHLKAIKSETKKKAKELVFCFPAENLEKRNRIKIFIEEACKLKKVSCSFLEV